MGRNLILTDQGTVVLREAKANGTDSVTLQAPASLAAAYTLTLPVDDGAANEFLQTDGAGVLSWGTSTASLDSAYNNGSVITTDAGNVELTGAGGLQLTHSTPAMFWETTSAVEYNWRASAGTDILKFERGDQDADVTDDTFESILTIDGANRRVGINDDAPQEDLHLNQAGAAAASKIRVQADTGFDAAIQFYEAATNRFEMGYDDSRGGFVIGAGGFGADRIFIEDSTGDIGINEDVPDAKLHVNSAGSAAAGLFQSLSATTDISIQASGTTGADQVQISATGDDLRLTCGGNQLVHLDGDDLRVGIGTTFPLARLSIFSSTASEIAIFIDQNSTSGRGLVIDSEATSQPLIELQQLTTNTRGDIAFGTARTGEPTTPSEGDIWYNGTLERFQIELGGSAGTHTVKSPYGFSFGSRSDRAISGDAVTVLTGYTRVAAQISPGTDDLSTINSSPQAQIGDVIMITSETSDTITVKHNVGNIQLNGAVDRVLNGSNDNLWLWWNGSQWVEANADGL